MTKVSDLSPEERAAHLEEVRRTLERVDRTLAETASREVPSELWQPPQEPAPAPPPMLRRAAPPPPSPPVGKISRPQHDSAGRIVSVETFENDAASSAAGWEKFIRSVAAQKANALLEREVLPLAEEIGTDLTALQDRIRELEDRMTKSEAAITALLMDQEKRLAELEQRAVPPPGSRPTLVPEVDDNAAA